MNQKLWAVVAMLAVFEIGACFVIGGLAYIVFWMENSPWWLLIIIPWTHGACIAQYKLVNAMLFDEPAITYGMEKA